MALKLVQLMARERDGKTTLFDRHGRIVATFASSRIGLCEASDVAWREWAQSQASWGQYADWTSAYRDADGNKDLWMRWAIAVISGSRHRATGKLRGGRQTQANTSWETRLYRMVSDAKGKVKRNEQHRDEWNRWADTVTTNHRHKLRKREGDSKASEKAC